VLEHSYSATIGLAAGVGFCALAGLLWYGLNWFVRNAGADVTEAESKTPLSIKIDQMLTEARVIIPGAQALLGFQLVVILTRTFSELPPSSRFLHVAALCLVAVAMILLMTPAALHRISYGGEDSQSFFRQGSWFILLAPLPLGLGIALDLYVATAQASQSPIIGAIIALVSAVALGALWYAIPIHLKGRVS
jgi:Family of unknown function (DUF6328)